MSFEEKSYQIKLLSALAKVFGEEISGESEPENSILKNETLSFQAALRGPGHVIEAVRVKVESPLGKAVRVRAVELVPVSYPCGPEHDEGYLRSTPGMFPDRLRELDGGAFDLIAGQWRAIWIDIEAGENTRAGCYPVRVAMESESGELLCEASSEIEVLDTALPKQTLRHTEWFHADCLADYYHVEVFSERHWQILENFIRAAVKRGMNTFLTPCFTPPLDTMVNGERTTVQLIDVTVENGQYRFGFERLHRWVEMVKRCGGEYFEIAHLFTQWGVKAAPKIMAHVDGAYKRIFGWDTPAVGGEYTEFLHAYLPELTRHLCEWGIAEKTSFHISDEPSEEHLENYLAAKQSVEKELEGYEIIDALSSFTFYQKGVVKKPVCANDHITPFLEHHVPGLWTYYCTAQNREVSNRFMAQPSVRNRVLGWQLFRYDIEGFLHWGYNFYNTVYSKKHINPYEVTDAGSAFPAGDPFLVYPGEDGEPEESIRMMVLFHALQDLRALRLLESKIGHEKAAELLEQELGEKITFTWCPKNAETLLKLRERVNREIAGR